MNQLDKLREDLARLPNATVDERRQILRRIVATAEAFGIDQLLLRFDRDTLKKKTRLLGVRARKLRADRAEGAKRIALPAREPVRRFAASLAEAIFGKTCFDALKGPADAGSVAALLTLTIRPERLEGTLALEDEGREVAAYELEADGNDIRMGGVFEDVLDPVPASENDEDEPSLSPFADLSRGPLPSWMQGA